jgi:hypothetical protein
MALPNAKNTPPKARTRDNPEERVHTARIVGVVDLGEQPEWEYQGEVKPAENKVEFIYELPRSKMQDGRPHWVSEEMPVNFTVSEKDPNFTAKLAKRIIAAGFKPQDLQSEDILRKVIGAPVMVDVYHKKGYARVGSVSGVPSDFEVQPLTNPSFLFDWDSPTVADDFEALRSPLTKKKLQQSNNYPGSRLQIALDGGDSKDSLDEDVPF